LYEDDHRQIPIDSINDTKIKEEIEKLIKNYRLRKSKEIQVKMNITLHEYEYYIHKDEISI